MALLADSGWVDYFYDQPLAGRFDPGSALVGRGDPFPGNDPSNTPLFCMAVDGWASDVGRTGCFRL